MKVDKKIIDMVDKIEKDLNELKRLVNQPEANRVSVHGMYDMHVFHNYHATSVDDLINQWLDHIKVPNPAIMYGKEYDDIGPTSLCPVSVMADDQCLRRVGEMLHVNNETREPMSMESVEAYRKALLADPDISRILAENN